MASFADALGARQPGGDMRVVGVVGLILAIGLGCSGGSAVAPSPNPSPEPAPASKVEKRGKHKARPRGGQADPQPKVPASGKFDPIAGLSAAQLCSDDSLLLIKYPYDDLQKGTCHDVCCPAVPDHWCCDLDWPSSDVMMCS